jgi:BirA family biotin operon repressor/biotin-[acetyl-CoA-carboxylase] ligase
MYYPIFLEKTDSTHSYSIDLLAKSSPIEGTVITTYNQIHGKGQIGRHWFSGIDNNISFSLILYPYFLEVTQRFYLSMIIALSVQDSINELLGQKKCYIKWPNDLIVTEKKISGLLIHFNLMKNSINSCIISVGLNVNQMDFPANIPHPISLYNLTDKKYILEDVQSSILEKFKMYYNLLKEQQFSRIKIKYLSNLYKRGEINLFELPDSTRFQAEIIGVSEEGKLALNTHGKIDYYNIHEIKMILT